jgi:hypothetical protein
MYRMIIALVAGSSVLFLILTCVDSLTDPFSPENAAISLLLKSSTFQESDTAVTDTVGKTLRLGLCLYLTQHIDSTVIAVSPSSTRNDTVLKCTKKDRSIDTVFYDLVFASAGARTVSAIAYVGKNLRQVTAKIHIIARPAPNRKPELTVTGPRTIHPGQACTLSVSVDDPDSGQVATIDTLKCPQGSRFSDTIFTWLPTVADTGIDTVIFIARDNGSPVLTDTAKVKISVVDVPVAPGIVTQPQGLTRTVGQSAVFSVTVNADVNPAPTYQWEKNGDIITGANAATFSIGAVAIEDSGNYTVTIINSAGTVTSNPALLNVQYAPVIITQPLSQTLYLGRAAMFTVAAQGNPAPLYQWKRNGSVISGQTSALYSINSPGIGDSGKYTVSIMNNVDTVESDTAGFYATAMDVSAGGNHTLFLFTDGRLLACGGRQSGQFGAESQNDTLTPLQIGTNVQNMAAGGCHTLIVRRNRTLIACGSNSNGQLGDGSTTNRDIFVTVASEVLSAAGGDFHTFIHKSDNSLWACGWNGYGQLGNGTATDTSLPVYIVPGVQDVSSRYYHTLIVKTDGTVLACGLNSNGQLGTGDTARKLTPIQISSNAIAVSAGCAHSLMLKMDSSLWACGSGGYGQLCNGIKIDRTTMTKVMDGVKSMSAGGYFSLVLKSDGTLWTCGKNDHGQLGDGSSDDRVTPVQIMSNVKKVAAGFDFSLVIKSDGTVWGFGTNGYGKLGDASTNDHYSPVQIIF